MILDADQNELAQGARDFLKEACPPEVVRAAWEGDALEPLRHALTEMGFYSLLIPSTHGGLGLGALEATVLLEECGKVALPSPLLESLVASAGIARHGSAEQKERWLGPIAAGEVRATIQVEGWGAVVGAEQADVLVVATQRDELHVVPAERFHAEPVPVFDRSRRVSRVTPALSEDTRMGEGSEPARDLRNYAAVLSSAVLLGISDALLDRTVQYVGTRNQFGRPVGSFQAIKHRLADSHLLLRTLRPAIWAAARLTDAADPDAALHASVAKVRASDAAALTNEHALQFHGGIGFTWENHLHYWLKRGKALEQSYGSARWHRRLIADELFTAKNPKEFAAS